MQNGNDMKYFDIPTLPCLYRILDNGDLEGIYRNKINYHTGKEDKWDKLSDYNKEFILEEKNIKTLTEEQVKQKYPKLFKNKNDRRESLIANWQ